MKQCTSCKILKPLARFSVRKASPDGLAYKCRECVAEYRRGRGKEVYRKLRKSHYERNKEKQRASALEWYRQNRDAAVARHKRYKIRTAEQQRRYRQENRARQQARIVLRKAAQAQRTPPWLTPEHKKQMREIYKECARVSEASGVLHHVDHIVPLRGRDVSGLHVPWNLQILPGVENMSKSNRNPYADE